MNEETCTGECSSCGGCNGCSERVVLSCDREISFVSTITFAVRNFSESSAIQLVMECAKDTKGECYAGIKYYKDGEALEDSEERKYKIENTELSCLKLDFAPVAHSDKAEVTVFCENGSTLNIEHINVIKVK